jgi:hypothetical protein
MKIRKQLIADVETALGHLKDASVTTSHHVEALVKAASAIKKDFAAKANVPRVGHLEPLIGTEDLAAAGYSLRSAARAIGCTAGHLCRHFQGERPSARLQARLENLLKDTP